MNLRELEKIGLSDKKAKVYLAILELGKATAINIAKKTGIKRTTIYDIVFELTHLGYITELTKGAKRLFVAEDPEILVKLFETRLEEMRGITPLLTKMYMSATPRPKLRFYDGIEGARHLMEETLKMKGKDMLYWGASGDLVEIFGDNYVKSYVKRRVMRGITSYSITSKGPRTPGFIRTDTKGMREVRWLPQGIPLEGVLCIYDNKVMYISSPKESFGFVIESDGLSSLAKTLFRNMWESIKE